MKKIFLTLLFLELASCTGVKAPSTGGGGLPPVIAPVVSANDEPEMVVGSDGGFEPLVAPGETVAPLPRVEFKGIAN